MKDLLIRLLGGFTNLEVKNIIEEQQKREKHFLKIFSEKKQLDHLFFSYIDSVENYVIENYKTNEINKIKERVLNIIKNVKSYSLYVNSYELIEEELFEEFLIQFDKLIYSIFTSKEINEEELIIFENILNKINTFYLENSIFEKRKSKLVS